MTDFVANPNASWARTRVEITRRRPAASAEDAPADADAIEAAA